MKSLEICSGPQSTAFISGCANRFRMRGYCEYRVRDRALLLHSSQVRFIPANVFDFVIDRFCFAV